MPDTVTLTVYRATREKSSPSGNPSWTLHTSGGDYRTTRDAMFGYEVQNLIPRMPLVMKLTITRHDRVSYGEPVEPVSLSDHRDNTGARWAHHVLGTATTYVVHRMVEGPAGLLYESNETRHDAAGWRVARVDEVYPGDDPRRVTDIATTDTLRDARVVIAADIIDPYLGG